MEDNKMERVTRLFLAFVNDESGQDLIEYALIAGLIAVGAIAAMTLLSNNIGSSFNGVGNTITNAS
jgi:pilus assembly protein Flp/PilA